ncbi:hypothetical protein [Cupriavidus sp. RAF12]|uniref:hypothetical protein n=1 Tax=Cupriavidus sp. RAF12 TaxID=3233050 RepID=UPI003F933A61
MPDLINIPREAPEKVLDGLKASDTLQSQAAGRRLVQAAKEAGLGMRDYLTLAIDPRKSERASDFEGMNGYEVALASLNLPVKQDLKEGVLLQAASETFQTYPGTRAMFPEVIDDMLRWKGTQDQLESVAPLLAQSRTISGTEMVSTIVDDPSGQLDTFTVPELSRIPVRTIRTSQTSVNMFKHGSAYRTSYEFNRRASLDIMTPFAARVARELEISKVKAATSVLINGDGVNGAAAATALGNIAYGAVFAGGKSLKDNYFALAKFLMARAKAGKPVDIIAGGYDMFIELLFMFQPIQPAAGAALAALAPGAMGAPAVKVALPGIQGLSVTFVLSSGVPAGKLICYSKADTLEELVEAGSSISENERSILNQAITYVRTEVTGYKLAFGDTRTLLDCTQ